MSVEATWFVALLIVSLLFQLFKGTFYHCDGPDVHDIKNKTDCLNKGDPYRWINRKYNFDNLGQVGTGQNARARELARHWAS